MDYEKIRLAEAARLLEARLQTANDSLKFQDRVIVAFGICITVLSIGIPLFGVLYVKDLDDRVTNQVSRHLRNETKNRIEHAIELLGADENRLRFKGLAILKTLMAQLDEKQTLQLIQHAEKSKDGLVTAEIQSVLYFQENLALTQYYKRDYFDDTPLFDRFWMLVYLIKVDSGYLLEKFPSVKDKAEYFLHLVNAGKEASENEFVIRLLNDQSIVGPALEALEAKHQDEDYKDYKKKLLNLMDNIPGGKDTYCYKALR